MVKVEDDPRRILGYLLLLRKLCTCYGSLFSFMLMCVIPTEFLLGFCSYVLLSKSLFFSAGRSNMCNQSETELSFGASINIFLYLAFHKVRYVRLNILRFSHHCQFMFSDESFLLWTFLTEKLVVVSQKLMFFTLLSTIYPEKYLKSAGDGEVLSMFMKLILQTKKDEKCRRWAIPLRKAHQMKKLGPM